MPILGAILRPGRGTPAFQLMYIYAGQQFPTLSLANKSEHSTERSGSWTIEPAGPFTAEEWPDRVPAWLAVSEYALVCHGQENASYRIYGLKLKPTTMPPRCKELEVNVSVTGTAYLAYGAAGGRAYLDAIKRPLNSVGNTTGWLSAAAFRSRAVGQLQQEPQPQPQSQQPPVTLQVQLEFATTTIQSETPRFQHLSPLFPSAQTVRETTHHQIIPTPNTVKPLCLHVAKILVQDARTKGEECPITFDALRDLTQFAVPVCGHVCSESATQLTRCPVCREPTSWCTVELSV